MSNQFAEVVIAKTFIHPSGMEYKKGTKIKLTTPLGVKLWAKEGWIEAPAEPAPTAPAESVTPPPAAA